VINSFEIKLQLLENTKSYSVIQSNTKKKFFIGEKSQENAQDLK
jgi:hypothetical protein